LHWGLPMTCHSGSTEAKAIDDVRSLEHAHNVQAYKLFLCTLLKGGGGEGGGYSIVAES